MWVQWVDEQPAAAAILGIPTGAYDNLWDLLQEYSTLNPTLDFVC